MLLTLLVMVPTAVCAVIAERGASESIRERVADGQLAVGSSLAQQAERDFRQIERQHERLVAEPEIAAGIFRTPGAADLQPILADRLADSDSAVRMAAYDGDDRLIASAPADQPALPTGGGTHRISEATARVSRRTTLVVLTYPIEPPAGAPAGSTDGSLVIEVDLSRVTQSIAQARFGDNGRATLALADGSVLVTGDPAKRGRVLPSVVGSANDLGPAQTVIDEYVAPITGERELAVVTRLDNGWFLVVTQPHDEAFAPVGELRNRILVAALVTLVVGSLFAYWIAALIARARDRLVASEQRAHRLTDVSSLAYIGIDQSGRISDWNPAAEQLFGWTAAEAIGQRTIDLVVPPDFHEQHMERLRGAVAAAVGGVPQPPVETLALIKGGDQIEVEVTISSYEPEEGRQLFAFVQDITARKHTEQVRAEAQRRLERANAELRTADELKSDFLAIASHELRTPVTSILGFSSTMLSMWDRLDDTQRVEYLEIIDGQAHRLARLIADLLTLSRIERGKLTVRPRVLDLRESIDLAVRDTALDVEVQVTCPPEITVEVDDMHLQQMLTNLLVNASKYGRGPIVVGGRIVHAETEDDELGERYVELSVSDHGDGVPERFVPRLFERFSQASNVRSRDPRAGLGLGLSIVAGLAAAQGGDVRYERCSTTGGACFIVRLPLSG